MDPFVKPVTEYTRTYDLKRTYVDDAALYLSKMEKISLEEARAFVIKTVRPGGLHPIEVPQARFLERNSKGDREMRQLPFDQYLDVIRNDREILAPNLTSYMHPDQKQSVLALYIDGNLQKRKKAKHEQFAAERAGNHELMAIKKSAQTTFKIKNNALSGAHSSHHTILFNKSSHSTLTSGCRTATSYGNANNEKFLYGNRHYWSPAITKNNLISIINHTDYERLAQVMTQYNLRAPTIEEVMSMIDRSTRYYWRDPKILDTVRTLVATFNDLERAAVMYTGDMYHLAMVNPDFVRQFLTEMTTDPNEVLDEAGVKEWSPRIDGDMIAFISMLCHEQLFNPDTEKYQAFKEVVREPARGILYARGKHINQVLTKYAGLIQAFWVTDNLPSSIYYAPNIMRRGVIASDTDSTIFTVAYWSDWYHGRTVPAAQSLPVSATMIYLTSKIIVNILNRFSGNCGVAQQHIGKLSMKNEFFFPVFSLTTRAKHYFAQVSMQEGTKKPKLDFEIKGVALRNSNVAADVTAKAHALLKRLMDLAANGQQVNLRSVLRRVALIENEIKQSVSSGDYRWLKSIDIKRKDSYKVPESSNYQHYELWEAVFAPKYGSAPIPPYRAIRVSLDTDRKAKMQEWLASIEDREFAQRMEAYLFNAQRTELSTLLLPEAVLSTTGIPKELIPRLNLRNLISQTMEAFYIILECLGYFIKDKHQQRLLSDSEWLVDPNNPIVPFDLKMDE